MAPGHDDEELPFGRPPAPADRTWVHPSEFAAAQRTRERRAGRRLWTVGLLSAVTGALVVGAAWYVAGGSTDVQVVTQRVASVPIVSVAPRVTPADGWAAEVSSEARTSTVLVASADGVEPLAGAVAVHGDGYLLTSARALGSATEVVVHTHDGRILTAQVLGHDHVTDLSVLKVAGEVEPAMVAAAAADTGDVVAVVDPAGGSYRRVVTDDAASSVAVDGDQLIGMVGLDGERSALPAGSPVLDSTGAVVAILSATEPDSAATAVPIGVANAVAEAIISDGDVDHAWLGVSVKASDDGDGVVVTDVVADSPAADAGLVSGDRVLAVGDRAVEAPAAVVAALRDHRPGELLDVVVVRDEVERIVQIRLGTTTP